MLESDVRDLRMRVDAAEYQRELHDEPDEK
jgi:hypothetical protein